MTLPGSRHNPTSTRALVALVAFAAAAFASGCAVDGESDESLGEDPSAASAAEGEGGGNAESDEAACNVGDSRPCGPNDTGLETCEQDESGAAVWGACVEGGSSVVGTPIVLAFGGDDERVMFESSATGAFDLAGVGVCAMTDWPSAKTPWLAYDRNGNGRIDDGSELFGSMIVLATGARARNGFEALAELDSDGDRRITRNDAAFSKLVLWSDADLDRLSSQAELRTLESAGVVSIDVAYATATRCDARGNCERERAAFEFAAASGETRRGAAIDVHLKFQK